MKNGHYREPTKDYSIRVGDGSIYIKPRDDRLIITAHPNAESVATLLFGKFDDRESPESSNYAKWEILK